MALKQIDMKISDTNSIVQIIKVLRKRVYDFFQLRQHIEKKNFIRSHYWDQNAI